VPLHEAAEAFSQEDASGRIPIIVVPWRLYRFVNGLVIGAGMVLVAGALIGLLLNIAIVTVLAVVLAMVLLVLGIVRWFYVLVPEGANALLARRGRHTQTIDRGLHFVPPNVAVTHLVTRRELPYDVPVLEARTEDDVRAEVDALITFSIADPARFVYRISANDFDQVFQAICQEALRSQIRRVPSTQLGDLARQDMAALRAAIESAAEPYGVALHQVRITYALPPPDFLRSQEERQLAVLQRAEQAEKQALAEQRQSDADTLARQQLLARIERAREELEAQLRQIEARRKIIVMEAEGEAERLARLEERLRRYPLATKWEWDGAQLDVARALAGNTRAILQVGSADDIAHALMTRDVLGPPGGPGTENGLTAVGTAPDRPAVEPPPADGMEFAGEEA
jgi:regulator of protease activity HflC (stomatin/prohibitin superfamily)